MIESHPTWIGALILRGHAYLRKDEMNEARESFQDAVNLDGRDRDARLGVAVACLKLKETADALESLDQLLSVHPEDGMAVVLRADALLQDGQRTEGLQYIQAILTGVKGPIKVEFLAKLIPLQLRAQDYANAESAASEWIATKPAGDAYAYRAEARRATKKLDDALADVVAGFKESAGQLGYPLLLNASQVWIDRGDAVTAICTLVDLLERVPGAYRARGGIRLQLEEYGYAISDFKSAILKGDTSVDVLMYLAECQPFMDVNAAKETYQKIIAMPPQGFRYMSVSDAVIAQARLYLVEHLTPPRP